MNSEEEQHSTMQKMSQHVISPEIFAVKIRKTCNWKAPGSDKIHNYWLKKFTCLHPKLLNYINEWIQQPKTIPTFLLHGVTYLLRKTLTAVNPSQYRPITCLQSIYKIIKGCITNLVNDHINKRQTSRKAVREDLGGARSS